MLNLGIILAILLIELPNLSSATDYCDPKLCPSSENRVSSHIGCKNNGKFAENCEEPSVIGMTSYLADAILFTHNDLRNKVANGSLPRFESAKRMPTFSWDSELQYLAGLNILRCELKHDECHNTPEYKWSGQNLGIIHKSVPFSQSEYQKIIVDFIKEWFNEHRNAVQGDVDMCIGNTKHDRRIGHFTQLVQEKTSKLGCSIVTFSTSMDQRTWSSLLMACDYSYGNLIDWPIYRKGPMASECLTGPHPNFNGLCSASECVPPVPDWPEKLGSISAVTIARSSAKLVPTRETEPLTIFQSAPSSQIDSPVPSARLFPTIPTPRGFDWPEIGSPVLSPRDSEKSENRPRFSRRVSHPRTSRPFRASTVRRFSRPPPPPQTRYRDLVQPLMPIPTPIIALGRALQQVATFFIIPG